MLDADVACKLVQGFYVNAFVCLCAQPKIHLIVSDAGAAAVAAHH